jgi:hypothetical protein
MSAQTISRVFQGFQSTRALSVDEAKRHEHPTHYRIKQFIYSLITLGRGGDLAPHRERRREAEFNNLCGALYRGIPAVHAQATNMQGQEVMLFQTDAYEVTLKGGKLYLLETNQHPYFDGVYVDSPRFELCDLNVPNNYDNLMHSLHFMFHNVAGAECS